MNETPAESAGGQVEALTADVKALGRPMGKYQGVFPHGFLDWLDREYGIKNRRVLFPFGGITPDMENWVVNDVNDELDVDTNHDARDLPAEWTEEFDVVVSDPPYDDYYADEYYDVEYPRPKDHFVEAERVLAEGGLLLILDWLIYQNHRPNKLERLHPVAITTGPNTRIRALNRFRKYNTLEGAT